MKPFGFYSKLKVELQAFPPANEMHLRPLQHILSLSFPDLYPRMALSLLLLAFDLVCRKKRSWEANWVTDLCSSLKNLIFWRDIFCFLNFFSLTPADIQQDSISGWSWNEFESSPTHEKDYDSPSFCLGMQRECVTEKEERKRVCVCEREQERHLDGYSFLFLHLSGRLNSTGFVTMNLSESFRKGGWLVG